MLVMNVNNSMAENDASNREYLDTETDKTHSPAIEKYPLFFSKRLLVVMLLFLWNIVVFVVRNNITVAVVDMTFHKRVTRGNITILQPPEFHWDSKTIGTVIGLTSYGGLLQFMSGFLMSCALSLMVFSITTLLHPIILRSNFYLFLACRLVTGIFTGFYSSISLEIFSRWVPQSEKIKLMAFFFNGCFIGLTVVHPFCGFIAFKWRWPMIFYITGSIGAAMAFLCLIFLKSDPSEDKSVSRKELLYILDGIETRRSSQKVTHSYKDIATSLPIWMLCIANFAHMCGMGLLMDCFPLFTKDITQKNTKDVAYIAAIPNFASMVTLVIIGILVQRWKNNTNITTTRLHKIMMGIGFVGQMFLILTLTLVSNFTIIMSIMVAIRLFTTLNSLALQLILIEVAPGHTGMIAGLTGFCSSLGNAVAQTIIGFLTVNRSVEEWNHCFILIAGILAFSIITFTLFGSSEAQPWSLSTSSSPSLEENGNSRHTSIKTIAK